MTTTPEQPTVELRPEPPTTPERPAGNGAVAGAPTLADGIELLGESEDSGFKEAHHVARREDGQVIQLSRLLHVVAEQADGRSDYRAMAERTSEELDRKVSADNVQFLVEKKLRPLGVLASADGTSPELKKSDPLLGLKFRCALVPARATRVLTTIFKPMFLPPVIAVVLAGLVAVDIWFFFMHGAAQSTRELLYSPILLLMVLGLVVIATALHEIGHATALRYGGGEPGVMGAGVYIVWPAFYTDVTDAYRLNRVGRLRTDFGGVYFNVIFILLIFGAYMLTGFEPLLVLIPIQHFQIIQQMLPFLRLDGYYILSDLTGVPDLFSRIKPTLKSAMPGKEAGKKVKELKPWVRVVTTTWVLLLIPILIFIFGLMIFNAPRMFATAWDSFFVQVDKLSDAWKDGNVLGAISSSVQSVALVLPVAGMTYSFTRIGARITKGAWSWTEGAPIRRAAVGISTVGMAVVATWVLLPNGDYRPIQPGERGTLQGGALQFTEIASGRPALTEERKEELNGAPTERSKRGVGPSESEDEDTLPTDDPETTTGTTDTTETTETVGGTPPPAEPPAAEPPAADPPPATPPPAADSPPPATPPPATPPPATPPPATPPPATPPPATPPPATPPPATPPPAEPPPAEPPPPEPPPPPAEPTPPPPPPAEPTPPPPPPPAETTPTTPEATVTTP